MALGGNALGVLEARIQRELAHHLAALRHAEVLGGDGGLA